MLGKAGGREEGGRGEREGTVREGGREGKFAVHGTSIEEWYTLFTIVVSCDGSCLAQTHCKLKTDMPEP